MTTTDEADYGEPDFQNDHGRAHIIELKPWAHRRAYTSSPYRAVVFYTDGSVEWNTYHLYDWNSAAAWCQLRLNIKTPEMVAAEHQDRKADEARRIRIMQGKGSKEDARAILGQLESAEYELEQLRQARRRAS